MKRAWGAHARRARVFLAGAAVAAMAGTSTTASDLGGNVRDPQVVGPQRYADDVSAFYVGISGAYGAGGSDRFGLTTPIRTFPIGELDLKGYYGGIRGGWRGVVPATRGRDYVYGFELGYDWSGLDDDVVTDIAGTVVRGGSEINNVMSVRFKNGLTNPSGTVLYFLTLGLIYGDITTTNSITSGGTTQSFDNTDSRNGFTASIGAEHQLGNNWSITGEFEYVQFQSEVIEFGSGFSTKSTPSYKGLRFGLNYRF